MTSKLETPRGPSPRYEPLDAAARPSTGDNPFSSTHRMSTSSSSATGDDLSPVTTAPPPYTTIPTSSSKFAPTHHLQIETPGKPWLSLPLPPRPDPIPVFSIPTDSSSSSNPLSPSYVSLRPARCSGSCFLVSPSAGASAAPEGDEPAYRPLSTTTYRFGPNRPPIIRLFRPGQAEPTSNPFAAEPAGHPDDAVDLSAFATFPFVSVGLLTRAATFRCAALCPSGSFVWRYVRARERAALGFARSDSVLLLEHVLPVAEAYPTAAAAAKPGKDADVRTPVAVLLRNEAHRTRGSGGSTAGNGGRLMLDVAFFERFRRGEDGNDDSAAEKRDYDTRTEMVVVMAVTTALAMLKREVDRRRAQQIAIMAGAGAGGP